MSNTTDFRMATSFSHHPKTVKLKRRLGADGVLGLIYLLSHVAQHKSSDGRLVGMDTEDIAIVADWPGDADEFVKALVNIGFIDETDDGALQIHDWVEHNPWAAGSEARSEKAKKAALKRWENKQPNVDQGIDEGAVRIIEQCSEHNQALPLASESNAPSPAPLPTPSPNQKNMGTVVPISGTSVPQCPHQNIVELYHKILPELAQVRDWTADRQKMLRSRWKEKSERQSLDWWRGYFEFVRQCPHLMGDNDRNWEATLEWLVRPKNFVKVVEGNYQQKAESQ